MPKHHRRRYLEKPKPYDIWFNRLAIVSFIGLALIVIETYV